MAACASWGATAGPMRQALRGATHHHGSTVVATLEQLRYVPHNTRGRLHRSHGPSRYRHPQPRSSAVRTLHQHHLSLYDQHHHPPLLTDYARWRRSTTPSRRVGAPFHDAGMVADHSWARPNAYLGSKSCTAKLDIRRFESRDPGALREVAAEPPFDSTSTPLASSTLLLISNGYDKTPRNRRGSTCDMLEA